MLLVLRRPWPSVGERRRAAGLPRRSADCGGHRMQQLSGQDASFIYAEQTHAPTHVLSVGIYDQSTAPGKKVTFKGILAHLEPRLHLARAFRQKAVRVPGDLDHPWWVEDAAFDLEYHVRHIALPKPGDWRQFCIQVARLHSRPLDLSKPQWEMYVIEGLDAVEGRPEGRLRDRCSRCTTRRSTACRAWRCSRRSTPRRPKAGDPPPPATAWVPERDPSAWELLGRAGLQRGEDPGAGDARRRQARAGARASGRPADVASRPSPPRRSPGSTRRSAPTEWSTAATSSSPTSSRCAEPSTGRPSTTSPCRCSAARCAAYLARRR